MSATTGGSQNPAMTEEGVVGRFLRATEIDTRMLGMIGALLLIWAGFDLYGLFFKPGDGLLGGQFAGPLVGGPQWPAGRGSLGRHRKQSTPRRGRAA